MIIKHAARKSGTRDRLLGLIEYLAGPGRHEEHSNQRIVAAWDPNLVESDFQDPLERYDLAREMDGMSARWREMETPKGGFVYHVPISLHPDDPQLSDEQWGYVARKVIDKLGFGGDGGCRWIAVHHGAAQSEEGPRDHIHLVVHLAREDGRIADTWNDRYKMAEVRAELEDDPTLGLRVKTQRQVAGRDGWHRGERAKAERQGSEETDRERLERLVRSAVGGAESESEWIESLRRKGVLVRPRFASGGREEVVGYSVALPPTEGDGPIWYGGGRLSKDLALPSVRRRWDGHDPADAVSTWVRTTPPDKVTLLPGSAWLEAQHALNEFSRVLAETPLHDGAAWRSVARETAEALSGLAGRAPADELMPLRAAAIRLARTAETPVPAFRGRSSRGATAMATTCRVISNAYIAQQGGMVAIMQLVLQLAQVAQAVSRANAAVQNAAAARHAALAEAELLGLHQRMAIEHRSDVSPHRVPTTAAELAQVAYPQQPLPEAGATSAGKIRPAGRRVAGRERGHEGPER